MRRLLDDELGRRARRGSRARSGCPSSPSAGRRPPPGRAARRRGARARGTVGSSRSCSSPTSAFAIASRIAARRLRLRVGAEVDHARQILRGERSRRVSKLARASIRTRCRPDLPVPEDDGAADHLPGARIPLARARVVARAGRPRRALRRAAACSTSTRAPACPACRSLPGWDEFPARAAARRSRARSATTPRSSRALGARVAGLSAQTLDDQVEFAERNHMPFPVHRRPRAARCARRSGLPTFEIAGHTLYKRLALVAARGRDRARSSIPCFPPDRNAGDVVAWLRREPVIAVDGPRSGLRGAAGRARVPLRQVWEWAARGATSYARDDEPAGALARAARGARCRSRRSTLVARGEVGRRHGEGALPHARRAIRSRPC